MKRSLLLLSSFFLSVAALVAQPCTADPQFIAGGVPGVFPQTGDTTIIYCCQNTDFEFTFTAVVPDSITQPLPIALTSINIQSLAGLPAGFTYVCHSPDANGNNAADCIFHGAAPNQQPLIGCMKVTAGAAQTGAANIQQYPLTINTLINNALPVAIPGPILNYRFIIEVVAQGDNRCSNVHLNVHELNDGRLTMSNIYPNPSTGQTYLYINSIEPTDLIMTITNVTGQTVSTTKVPVASGNNAIMFDGSFLPNGIYMFNLTDGKSIVSQKVMIAH